jgi:hypothetical protein
MQEIQSAGPRSPKPPTCPACHKATRLERAAPDVRYRNLQRMPFKCDCGWESDRLVADTE